MRSVLSMIILALIAMGCASSKKNVYTPAGTWDYVVYNTPNGDVDGQLILVQTEAGMDGVLSSPAFGDTDLDNLVYGGEEKSLNASFYLDMAGMDFLLKGNFEGDTFTGTVDGGQMGVFEMKATRQVEN